MPTFLQCYFADSPVAFKVSSDIALRVYGSRFENIGTVLDAAEPVLEPSLEQLLKKFGSDIFYGRRILRLLFRAISR